jgi:predicted enzyme related to lactoylglutathione lyase
MKSAWLAFAFLPILTAAVAGPACAQATAAPIVFFDIAGPDLAKQHDFYAKVFGWTIAPGGQLTVSVVAPAPGSLAGTLRQDPAEKVLYIGVPDVTAALAKVVANGGAVVTPKFVVPGVVILGLFKDPAGNRMGLVEMAAGKPIVPPAK